MTQHICSKCQESDESDSTGILLGTVFDTPTETKCIALGEPDNRGNFTGMNVNGDIGNYTVIQVEFIYVNELPLIIV